MYVWRWAGLRAPPTSRLQKLTTAGCELIHILRATKLIEERRKRKPGYLVWGSHWWRCSSVVAAHGGGGMVHDRVAGGPRCSCVRCIGAPCHWRRKSWWLWYYRNTLHYCCREMELLSVSMKVELVGGEWLCCRVKKKVTVQVLEWGDAAGVEVCYCCWALLTLHGRKNLYFSRLRRWGRLSWVFGRRRWEVYRWRFVVNLLGLP